MHKRKRSTRLLGVLLTLALLLTMTPLPALGGPGHIPEPNDIPSGAHMLAPPSDVVTDTIDYGEWDAGWDYPSMDWDYYSFEVTAGTAYAWWLDDLGGTYPFWGMHGDPYSGDERDRQFQVYGESTPFVWTASTDTTVTFAVSSYYSGDYSLNLSSPEDTGTISGAVKDDVTHAPLEGITVIARYDGNEMVAGTSTLADGTFELQGLENGAWYELWFYDSSGEYLSEYWQDAYSSNDSQYVSAAATTDIGWAELGRVASISGTVYDPNGQPLADAWVYALVDDPRMSVIKDGPDAVAADRIGGGLVSVAETMTDEFGGFTLEGLRPVDYSLLASRKPHLDTFYGDVWTPDDAVFFAVTSGQDVTGKDINMLRMPAIEGTVTNQADDPLADTYIELYQWTDELDIRFKADGIPAPRAPAEGFQLPSIGIGPDEDGYWRYVTDTNTDPDGYYDFGRLYPGEYAVLAMKPGYASQSWQGNPHDPYAADRIELSVEETLTADFVMNGGGAIEGTLTANGEAVPGRAVAYWYQDGTWVGVRDAWNGPDGEYTLDGLVPGTYRIGFEAPGFASEYYDDVALIAHGTDVGVSVDTTVTGISGDLGAGYSIEGTVTSEANVPLYQVHVEARYLDASQRPYDTIIEPEWVTATHAWSDTDGSYTLSGLNPDREYIVTFNRSGSGIPLARTLPSIEPDWEWGDSYCAEVYDDLPHYTGAAPYWETVSVGSSTPTPSVDASLTVASSVWGNIYDSEDNDLDGILVKLYYNVPEVGWTLMDTQYSGDAEGPGSYYFWPLKSGEWKVVAYDPSGTYGTVASEPFTVDSDDGLRMDLEMPRSGADKPIAGKDRYGTSVAISRLTFAPGEADAVVIASGVSWPDTLGGAALAAAMNGPVLLTRPGDLPGEVKKEIERLGVADVVIIGGENAVSKAVFNAVNAIPGVTPERIAGSDRFQTSSKVARRVASVMGGSWHGTAIVATGDNYPDAMAASPLSSGQMIPVLLTRPDVAPSTTMNAIEALGVTDVILLGDTSAVSAHVRKQLAKTASVTRLGGEDRYHTAALIAQHAVNMYGHDWDLVGFASGHSYPDALVSGVLQGSDNSVLMLTAQGYLPSAPKAMLIVNKDDISTVRFFGGNDAIKPAVRSQILNIVN